MSSNDPRSSADSPEATGGGRDSMDHGGSATADENMLVFPPEPPQSARRDAPPLPQIHRPPLGTVQPGSGETTSPHTRITVESLTDSDGLLAFPAEHAEGGTFAFRWRRVSAPAALFGSGMAVGALSTVLLTRSFSDVDVDALARGEAAAAVALPAAAIEAPEGTAPVLTASTAGSVDAAPDSGSTDPPLDQVATVPVTRQPVRSAPISPRPAPSPPTRAAPSSFRGSLEVVSTPAGAAVFVNGIQVGTTPLVLENLPVGSRAIRAELDGYVRWSSVVTVVANERAVARAVMRPAPLP